MELEEGMCVRFIASFKNNSDKPIIELGKIDDLNDNYLHLDIWRENEYFPMDSFKKLVIGNPSFDVIDLIEIGDYANGERIQFINNKRQLITDGGYDILKKYTDIKSILTHEQFDLMKYEIGEK